MISYQYTTTQDFFFGVAFTAQRNSRTDPIRYITEPYRDFELSIELSNTLGSGNRITMDGTPISCSFGGPQFDFVGDKVQYFAANAKYKYCNGKLENKSDYSATVRVLVVRNFNAEEDYLIW